MNNNGNSKFNYFVALYDSSTIGWLIFYHFIPIYSYYFNNDELKNEN